MRGVALQVVVIRSVTLLKLRVIGGGGGEGWG